MHIKQFRHRLSLVDKMARAVKIAVKVLLVAVVMIMSLNIVLYVYLDYYYSWTDIIFSLMNWSTYGYILTAPTIIKAITSTVVIAFAVTALIATPLYMIQQTEQKRNMNLPKPETS
jgi:cbb3-type cytochrome oxidase subunit 1